MQDVEQALSQIADIRARMASSTRFHGFAPEAILGTGLLALAAALAQNAWPTALARDAGRFILVWIGVAAAAAALIAIEGLARAARLHGPMAGTLIASALRQMLPLGMAGLAITLVLYRAAPSSLWILPGLWLILLSLMGFTAQSSLPRAILWPAAWYFACGVIVLDLAGRGMPLSPWMMAVPLVPGQAAVALILHRAGETGHGR